MCLNWVGGTRAFQTYICLGPGLCCSHILCVVEFRSPVGARHDVCPDGASRDGSSHEICCVIEPFLSNTLSSALHSRARPALSLGAPANSFSFQHSTGVCVGILLLKKYSSRRRKQACKDCLVFAFVFGFVFVCSQSQNQKARRQTMDWI